MKFYIMSQIYLFDNNSKYTNYKIQDSKYKKIIFDLKKSIK